MESLSVLGTLMGLAFTSGLRLYSTVLAVGLATRFGYLSLPPALSQLEVLERTPILVIAAVCFVLEFVADKIPWVDSIWDAVHTFIRPIGAGVLAATALGAVDPAIAVGAALLSGGIALSSHSAKAGTRIAANHSPEPFSNIALSVAEDGIVLGGVWLALAHPIVALVLVGIAVLVTIWLIPKLIRLLRREWATIRGLFKGIKYPYGLDPQRDERDPH